jgi:uncharacterized membrane protein YraQ (UPF0718 family)
MEWFKWLNDQVLRMDWLAWLVRTLPENGLGLDMSSRFGARLHFFIYEVLKIFILHTVLIFCIFWAQSYVPPQRTRRILGGMSGIKAKLTGALLGSLTPFCACSSIPLFIGFTRSAPPLCAGPALAPWPAAAAAQQSALAEVALAWGLASARHFNNRFRQAFSATPGQYRAALQRQ